MVAVSNSVGNGKMQYNDVRDQIVAKEVRRKDLGDTSKASGSALNVENGRRS